MKIHQIQLTDEQLGLLIQALGIAEIHTAKVHKELIESVVATRFNTKRDGQIKAAQPLFDLCLEFVDLATELNGIRK